MPRLPPVPSSPHTRLRARLSCGLTCSTATFFQSHSSSSATSCAKPVMVPWPISERAMRMTQVSSGLMNTQAFTSAPALWARAMRRPGTWNPRASPLVAAPTTKVRRETCVWIVFVMADLPILNLRRAGIRQFSASAARPFGGQMQCGADALIGAAAADIGDRVVDVFVARRWILSQQRRGRHYLSGLAVAALRHVEFGPGALHRMRGGGRQTLDGDDLVGRIHRAHRNGAGALHFTIDMHRAGAALRHAASVFGSGQPDLLAEHPKERRVRLDIDFAGLAVDIQGGHACSSPSCLPRFCFLWLLRLLRSDDCELRKSVPAGKQHNQAVARCLWGIAARERFP